ncbi:hypothetical protein C8N46_107210 [Kordia periserrulae]|uniref:DKNYY family protein n=1 Tax=Kordia periserrulae TaxID=701523 RepID=A0A2T6BVW3_9FLAO|nr:hypothetical protein [Kordia periserrulae]PTX60203.1 hypothetical protein C8N46_107210 [Kordia periserrulae]
MARVTFFIVFSCFLSFAQENTLLYTEHIDYYSPHAKSTILTEDLQFLKDGQYTFKGSTKDFKFLLNTVLKPFHLENLQDTDTLYFSGEIKDAIKINQWKLYKKVHSNAVSILKKELYSELDFGTGKKLHWLEGFQGKYNYTNTERYVIMSLRNHKKTDSIDFYERIAFRYDKKSDDTNYRKEGEFYCKNYEGTTYQKSNKLEENLFSSITLKGFDASKESEYFYIQNIQEYFKNEKLIGITITYDNRFKGKTQFEKCVTNTNFLNYLYGTIECLDTKN